MDAADYNPQYKKNIENQNKVRSDKPYRFAIVGSGPAGFYTAKSLLRGLADNCRIDIYDRNPHPFGLIRTGVAPDHQAMKKIENDFDTVLQQDDKVRFFGNVWVGQKEAVNGSVSISLQQLQDKYSAVVLAYGAVSDRDLGLEGEYTTKNVFPSRKVVDWYNGSLDNRMQPSEFDLSQIGELAIVGNGNVACDIARMMLKKPEEFKDSDTPSPVMNALANTSLHCVQMIGRRGTVQTAFTTKEIRELTSLDNLGVYMVKPEVLDSKTDASDLESLGRGIERRTDFLHKRAALIESAEQYEDLVNDKSHRKLILRYLRSPTEIMVDDQGAIEGMKMQRNVLYGEADHQKTKAYESGLGVDIDPAFEEVLSTLRCQAMVKSIGYKSLAMQGVPFDNKRNVIRHEYGAVIDPEQQRVIRGLYCSGWVKRGPVGIIDHSLRDASETYKVMKAHLDTDVLESKTTSVDEIREMLAGSNGGNDFVVEYNDWLKVDKLERSNGQLVNKKREKVLSKAEMIELASSSD